ncbi:hypothetical protein [Microvirga thermotolerans]|uniref:Uncharacterized protein n=1 Tax=Microvirga thermotolerans TaxID=2651334 RepID=A0A5P9JYB1_9HYPH|nr:hypothetical protein [Microvirga thermotolerans]QFU17597.1 hypothetical protein GDR74_16020 [Microvirga thermotolerans]
MPLRLPPARFQATALAAVFLCAAVLPGEASLRLQGDSGPAVSARFDPLADRTRIAHRIGNLCVTFALPRVWRVTVQDDGHALLSAPDGTALEAVLRPARDVEDMPQPDLASRDAALLQRDHESLFGRPAQSATLVPMPSGAKRWTATWTDANLPGASREVTLDTVIVPLSEEWLLELSLARADAPAVYGALAAEALAGLRREPASACRAAAR